jgi:hypothetical protein
LVESLRPPLPNGSGGQLRPNLTVKSSNMELRSSHRRLFQQHRPVSEVECASQQSEFAWGAGSNPHSYRDDRRAESYAVNVADGLMGRMQRRK